MTIYILLALGAFVLSALCGFVSIPMILRYCQEKKLYDVPNARKVHANNIPRLGGVAFMPSALLSLVVSLVVLSAQASGTRLELSLWSLFFMISLLMIYSVGIVDDLIGLSPAVKFGVQIAAACMLPLSNLYINNLYGLFGIGEISIWIGAPLTVLVIVFIDNAMNLIDGIDGLCAGLSMMALACFFYVFWADGLYVYSILIAGMMGVLVPYIRHNVFGKAENNSKIFMGDSGSLTLGFVLGFLFVKYAMHTNAMVQYHDERLLLAYSFLFVPTFDVVRVVFHRMRHRKPLFGADKSHIHHKLMDKGLTMRETLVAILFIQAIYVAGNVALFQLLGITWVFIIDMAVYTAFNLILNYCVPSVEG